MDKEFLFIKNTRDTLTEFVEYMIALPDTIEYREAYHNSVKDISMDVLADLKTFFLPAETKNCGIPDKYLTLNLGLIGKFGKVLPEGRFCYPIRDAFDNVLGLVAHDPFEDLRYLDIKSYGFTTKRATVFGMEKSMEYYQTNDPVFFTEGIGCMAWLRSQGFKSYALLGSSISSYVMEFIKRHKNPIVVPDSDEAGSKLRIPVLNNDIRIYTVPYKYGKDIDDARKTQPTRILNDLKNFYY